MPSPVRFITSPVAHTGLVLIDRKHTAQAPPDVPGPALGLRVGDGASRAATLAQVDTCAAGARRPPILNRIAGRFPTRASLSFSLGGALRASGALVAGAVGAGLAVAAGVTVVGVAVALWPMAKIGQLVNRFVTEPLAEKRFHNAHLAQWTALARPMEGSIVYKPGAMDVLTRHASIGGRVSRTELDRLVATGEHLITALKANGCDADGRVRVRVGAVTHSVAPSACGARAISWYLMAVAAREQAQAPDLLPRVVKEGAYILKDPDRRLYRFLNACPTARPRPSTHFNERAGHEETYVAGGILATRKPAQRGIEDFLSRMPGQGGTLLFDTLRSSNGDGVPELFIKWESEGTQAYGAHEAHHNAADRCTRWLAAHHRYMAHAMDFVRTRPRALTDAVGARLGRPPALTRKEHGNQGPLKTTVHQGLLQVTAWARAAGLSVPDARQVSSAMSRAGLQGVEEILNGLRATAGALPHEHPFLPRLAHFESRLDAAIRGMETVDGMCRRGAEVQLPVFSQDLRAGDFLAPADLTADDFLLP